MFIELLVQFLDLSLNAFDVSIELRLTKIKVKNILALLAARHHAWPELCTIERYNIFATSLPLYAYCSLEVFAYNFIGSKVVNSSLHVSIAPTRLNDFLDVLTAQVT